ncbi:hypothetical protein C8J57DRAFT_1335966 [Mycena rebaudengoi]|nr:hypothetical protein C8J57DRAFT_1335966 [Mycena rebaudengoi]
MFLSCKMGTNIRCMESIAVRITLPSYPEFDIFGSLGLRDTATNFFLCSFQDNQEIPRVKHSLNFWITGTWYSILIRPDSTFAWVFTWGPEIRIKLALVEVTIERYFRISRRTLLQESRSCISPTDYTRNAQVLSFSSPFTRRANVALGIVLPRTLIIGTMVILYCALSSRKCEITSTFFILDPSSRIVCVNSISLASVYYM